MTVTLLLGDCIEVLRTLPAESVQTCITSPPYFGLRSYDGGDAEIGKESTPDEYVAKLVAVFREVRRVLRPDGTLWLNLGSSYNGSGGAGGDYGAGGIKEGQPKYPGRNLSNFKPKDMIPIPWMVAMALQQDGYYLRADIIWSKPNPMPESVTDRPTKAHEYIFLLAKAKTYFYDADSVREPHVYGDRGGAFSVKYRNEQLKAQNGSLNVERTMNPLGRNRRSVWSIPTSPYKGAHFATFPPKLVEPMVLAGCPYGGTVLDCFSGAGTTGVVAIAHGRNFIGIELNPEYLELARERIGNTQPALFGMGVTA